MVWNESVPTPGLPAMEEEAKTTHVMSLQERGKWPADPTRVWRGAGQIRQACEWSRCRVQHELGIWPE